MSDPVANPSRAEYNPAAFIPLNSNKSSLFQAISFPAASQLLSSAGSGLKKVGDGAISIIGGFMSSVGAIAKGANDFSIKDYMLKVSVKREIGSCQNPQMIAKKLCEKFINSSESKNVKRYEIFMKAIDEKSESAKDFDKAKVATLKGAFREQLKLNKSDLKDDLQEILNQEPK